MVRSHRAYTASDLRKIDRCPAGLGFLKGINFRELFHRSVKGQKEWFVTIASNKLKPLILAAGRAAKLKAERPILKIEISRLRGEAASAIPIRP
jgi:hypothetical protein